MRVVFMGTPAFAVPSFEALAERHEVVAAVTRGDKPSGRGGSLRPSPVKEAALAAGVPVFQPSTLRGEAADVLRGLAPDVICVAAFGMLLPPEVLAIPPHGCINVHASLLPAYRGAAPIQRAILDGERVTGISIMLMEEGLDTGPYALQRQIALANRYADEVEAELARVGAQALLDVLEALERDSVVWTPQDDTAATYAAKLTKDDVALTPDISVTHALARVRASTRRAPARACVGDRELTIARASAVQAAIAPGAVCLHEGLPALGFADGAILLDAVRPAGKGDMPGAEWARGARLTADTCWRCTR